jgi:hypothetical protein
MVPEGEQAGKGQRKGRMIDHSAMRQKPFSNETFGF